MDSIIIIPFNHTQDVDKYAREHGVTKYTGMVLPDRGKNHPKKFLIVIEEMENPPDIITLKGCYCKTLEDVKYFAPHMYNNYRNPYVYWKLIDGNYIFFGANVNVPFKILK